MTQKYILDTSAILTDPHCIDSFPDSHVIIQIDVLNELDKIKSSPSAAGKNARVFVRMLDDLTIHKDIAVGIKRPNGSTIYLDSNIYDGSRFGDPTYTDNKILACADALEGDLTIVSNDINLRIRARTIGIKAEACEKEKHSIDELYSGFSKITDTKLGEQLKKEKYIRCTPSELQAIKPNECVVFQNRNGKTVSIGRKIGDEIVFIKNSRAWGLGSKNIEQAFAMDMLLDPDVNLVSLAGIAGTGKTLIAMACGLESVISLKDYDKLLIYRPIQPVGTDMGYLPGDLCDKLEPWMAAIKDSVDFLSEKSNGKNGRRSNGGNNWRNNLAQFSDIIHMEALTYIRGRSISNAFILIDETQNITRDEIKTILTRAGNGSKIVLTGDIEQIDNYHLDALNNGLTYVIEQFKDSDLAGHMTLKQGERSPLATLSAKIL